MSVQYPFRHTLGDPHTQSGPHTNGGPHTQGGPLAHGGPHTYYGGSKPMSAIPIVRTTIAFDAGLLLWY